MHRCVSHGLTGYKRFLGKLKAKKALWRAFLLADYVAKARLGQDTNPTSRGHFLAAFKRAVRGAT